MSEWLEGLGDVSEAERNDVLREYTIAAYKAEQIMEKGIYTPLDIAALGQYLDWVIELNAPASVSTLEIMHSIMAAWARHVDIPRWIRESVQNSSVLHDLRETFCEQITAPAVGKLRTVYSSAA